MAWADRFNDFSFIDQPVSDMFAKPRGKMDQRPVLNNHNASVRSHPNSSNGMSIGKCSSNVCSINDVSTNMKTAVSDNFLFIYLAQLYTVYNE